MISVQEMSLRRYPLAPASTALQISSSGSKLDKTITLGAQGSLCNASKVSIPLVPGMWRSSNNTSTGQRARNVKASSPLCTEPTTLRPAWRRRTLLNPARTTAWSSTMSSRIDALRVKSPIEFTSTGGGRWLLSVLWPWSGIQNRPLTPDSYTGNNAFQVVHGVLQVANRPVNPYGAFRRHRIAAWCKGRATTRPDGDPPDCLRRSEKRDIHQKRKGTWTDW